MNLFAAIVITQGSFEYEDSMGLEMWVPIGPQCLVSHGQSTFLATFYWVLSSVQSSGGGVKLHTPTIFTSLSNLSPFSVSHSRP